MRVISGTAKGRKLKTLDGLDTRPTSDRAKESAFNILNRSICGKTVLDLYAGSGALGIEALSRGAQSCVFVDSSPQAAGFIRENLKNTKLADKSEVVVSEVSEYLKRANNNFDVIFMDPPYNRNLIYGAIKLIAENSLLRASGIIVAECDKTETLEENISGISMYDKRKYGRALLNFYKIL